MRLNLTLCSCTLFFITVTPCNQVSRFDLAANFVMNLVTSNRIKMLNLYLSSDCFSQAGERMGIGLEKLHSYAVVHRLAISENSGIFMTELDQRSRRFTRRTVHFICANVSEVFHLLMGNQTWIILCFTKNYSLEISTQSLKKLQFTVCDINLKLLSNPVAKFNSFQYVFTVTMDTRQSFGSDRENSSCTSSIRTGLSTLMERCLT